MAQERSGRGGWLAPSSQRPSGLRSVGADPWRPRSAMDRGFLSGRGGLSRSAFAAHFTRLVGEAPLRYVTCWRMQLAQGWLRGSTLGLGDIAERLGYQSEDAFKRAFRREVGSAPGSYLRATGADVLVT
ncbi:MAG: hypothetical protein BZY87_00880 [SAR202 cluster bacterium Io17-Chloro-G6]|nr:MAG: hypothetical protein BZY87_00880 [SAR202 cluster bacterium Io17-Chloro-G6]